MISTKDIVESLRDGGVVPSKTKGDELVKAVFASIAQAITQGEQVRINGFGTFSPITRSGVSTLGGRKEYVSKSVKFQPSATLKNEL